MTKLLEIQHKRQFVIDVIEDLKDVNGMTEIIVSDMSGTLGRSSILKAMQGKLTVSSIEKLYDYFLKNKQGKTNI